MKKSVLIASILVIIVLIVVGVSLSEESGYDDSDKMMKENDGEMMESHDDSMEAEGVMEGSEGGGGSASISDDDSMMHDADVKEFSMDSFFEMEDGKPHPQFSMEEITVKKGDKVKIDITNIKGDHSFKIDEFDVFAETPLNETVTVEFTADKAGEFVYYCTKPGHRENGHWGTLKVTE